MGRKTGAGIIMFSLRKNKIPQGCFIDVKNPSPRERISMRIFAIR
jgi:hypothetical protein